MVLVRNKLLRVSDFRGRWTDACDSECPCRSCYHPHDYSIRLSTGFEVRMLCLSRANEGCSDILPVPQHIFTKRGKFCKRCGKEKNEGGRNTK